MYKAIGLITCASVMAVSLYLFSGGDPSRTLSAQTDSESEAGYGAVARRFLQDAREQAQKGNVAEARRLAGTAASLCSDWSDAEQSPDQFLKSLGRDSGVVEFEFDESDSDVVQDSSRPHGSDDANPFAEAGVDGDVEAPADSKTPMTGGEILKKKQAQRLIKEARYAMASGDTALARSRALQARQLYSAWGLWDDRPEHVLADLDKKSKTSTFVAGRPSSTASADVRPENTDESYQQASAMLSQARAAMDAGKLSEAQQLADQASKYDVAYGIFEDSPTMVSRDIKRLAASGSIANAGVRIGIRKCLARCRSGSPAIA